MKYKDGAEVRCGDRVKISNGEFASVVVSIDLPECSPDFRIEDWEYLVSGVLLKTDNGALVHMDGMNSNDFDKV